MTPPESALRPLKKNEAEIISVATDKESGAWFGSAPPHWHVKKLKYLARFQSGDGITSECIEPEGRYPVYGGNGLRGFTDNFTHDGEFVLVGRQGALCGNIKYACGRFWASEHAVVVTPRPGVELGWMGELLRAMDFLQYSQSAAQPGLSVDYVVNLVAPVPSQDEQQAIGGYLDRKTGEIDALIAGKRRMIDLLHEKRQALISEAVTKGLDPDVPMKDSGIEWLGSVPSHWGIRAFKHCGSIPKGQIDPRLDQYKTNVLIAPNHVEPETGRLIFTETAAEQAAISGKYQVREGNVIYSKIRPELQKACIAPGDCLCSADMYPITPAKDMISGWILYTLLCDWFTKYAVLFSDRVAMPKVNRETLGCCMMLVPPVNEQLRIVAAIDERTKGIDSITDAIDKQVIKLQEYRQTLISAAVTGKLVVPTEVAR